MTAGTLDEATVVEAGSPRARRVATLLRPLSLLAALALLCCVTLASMGVGSTSISWATILTALTAPDGASAEHIAVVNLRLPRTLLAIAVGASLAVAGALMQGLTRNPMADPGLLGINAGAGFAVTIAVMFLGVTRIDQYLPFAFLGAVLAAVVVYGIALRGSAGATPLRLTLVGLALGAVLMGVSRTLALMDVATFDRMRFWEAGTLVDRPGGTLATVLPWMIIGVLLALSCAGALNSLALGDDVARALGVRIGWTRGVVVVAVTLLCGAATAACGPLAFVGLMVPHLCRWVVGPDTRWIVTMSLVVGPVVLMAADILGRVMVGNGELQVGIVLPLLGAPLLVLLAHSRRARPL
ncbi:MAG: FecCD family ABC transporter permease [Micrococcaceae bacterium]